MNSRTTVIKDKSEYYELGTPEEVPLRFCTSGYHRVVAKATCRICGRGFMQVLRTHRIHWRERITGEPYRTESDPSEVQIATSLMLAACKNGVGNPTKHARSCRFGDPKLAGHFILAGMKSSALKPIRGEVLH